MGAAPGVVADVPDVRVRQVAVSSPDGTVVRAFVVARADLVDDDGRPTGPRPTILYGYGGFQISLDPAYSASTLAWVEAGGVYVVANLRGGGEEGEDWHRAGMREHKQNVFDDFHAVAQALVAEGWTTPAQLACWGGSNGGLLVGAALTQRPDLFAAAVCSAPLLDMVRYQRFGLGVTWTEEYGDADDPTELGWLLGYSPYHRVTDGTAYPATLFTVFEGDTRVDPLHARKLAAALQHATSAPWQDAPCWCGARPGSGTAVARCRARSGSASSSSSSSGVRPVWSTRPPSSGRPCSAATRCSSGRRHDERPVGGRRRRARAVPQRDHRPRRPSG